MTDLHPSNRNLCKRKHEEYRTEDQTMQKPKAKDVSYKWKKTKNEPGRRTRTEDSKLEGKKTDKTFNETTENN